MVTSRLTKCLVTRHTVVHFASTADFAVPDLKICKLMLFNMHDDNVLIGKFIRRYNVNEKASDLEVRAFPFMF